MRFRIKFEMTARLFVTLNLFQGRKGSKISFPAARFELIDFNLAIPNQVRNDGTLFVTLTINQPKNAPHPSPPRVGEGAVVEIRQYFVRMRMGNDSKTILKTPKSHFFTILRWEPFHFSHPTTFCHPELVSGSQGLCLSTSILRFRNKFGMTAHFLSP